MFCDIRHFFRKNAIFLGPDPWLDRGEDRQPGEACDVDSQGVAAWRTCAERGVYGVILP